MRNEDRPTSGTHYRMCANDSWSLGVRTVPVPYFPAPPRTETHLPPGCGSGSCTTMRLTPSALGQTTAAGSTAGSAPMIAPYTSESNALLRSLLPNNPTHSGSRCSSRQLGRRSGNAYASPHEGRTVQRTQRCAWLCGTRDIHTSPTGEPSRNVQRNRRETQGCSAESASDCAATRTAHLATVDSAERGLGQTSVQEPSQ